MSRNNQIHAFHLVDPSPWPIISAFSALILTVGGVLYMHGYSYGFFVVQIGFCMITLMMYCWWRDVIREAVFEGQHTLKVQSGLKIGMLLFITSEIMFFFAFFWAFFHSSINPTPFIGGVWPPAFLSVLSPWKIPLLNTVLLLSSGATLTLAHHALVFGSKKITKDALLCTLHLAFVFTNLQVLEYITSTFSISDGVYGSTFYMATGFHGFHVLVGYAFLSVCLDRLKKNHFTRQHHVGFEAAAWYWHFVDVVWLFLFITIYWWGS
jgi:cytochrome c oxidase subunit 3